MHLSNQERAVLSKLINSKNHIVTFDSLGDLLWGDQVAHKYSLYAISKVIENLRKKLIDFGLYKEVILTKRKQGYCLID